MREKFTVNDSGNVEALEGALGFIREQLGEMKLESKDLMRAELMCEESLVSLMNHANFSGTGYFLVNVRKIFGDVIIDLSVPGEEFEFSGPADISSLKDNEDLQESYEAIQHIVLGSFIGNIRYRHSGDLNKVRIKAVQSNYSGLYKTLAALFLAVVSGLLLKNFTGESVYMSVNDNILAPIRSVFLNGLKMCAVPIVFFSVVSSVADMGGFSGIKKTGEKLIKYFMTFNILGLVVGLCLMYVFRPGTGVNIPVSSEEIIQSQQLSFSGTLVNIIAWNIVRPFLEGDMLQIMMLAFLVGLAVLLTDTKMTRRFSGELNIIFMKITEIFLYMALLVVSCSAASMVITTGAGTLASAAGITFTVIGGHIIICVIFCLAAKFSAGLSPFTVLRKSVPMLTTAFSTCSSMATIPDALKCSDDMGVAPSLYSFSVPLGASLSKVCMPLYYSVLVLSAANLYGVDVDMLELAQLAVTIILLSVTNPAMPYSGVISLSVLLVQVGCPVEFVGLAVSIEMLIDFTETMTISFGNLVCTLLAAADGNLIDREKFNRP